MTFGARRQHGQQVVCSGDVSGALFSLPLHRVQANDSSLSGHNTKYEAARMHFAERHRDHAVRVRRTGYIQKSRSTCARSSRSTIPFAQGLASTLSTSLTASHDDHSPQGGDLADASRERFVVRPLSFIRMAFICPVAESLWESWCPRLSSFLSVVVIGSNILFWFLQLNVTLRLRCLRVRCFSSHALCCGVVGTTLLA